LATYTIFDNGPGRNLRKIDILFVLEYDTGFGYLRGFRNLERTSALRSGGRIQAAVMGSF